MHTLIFGDKFLKAAEKLERKLKPKLKTSLDILSQNPFHPALRTKSLSGKLAGYHSFRLDKDYRVVFVFSSNNTIHLLRVGNRKDIYR